MKYELPSGMAYTEAHHPLGTRTYAIPAKRQELEAALHEALRELWQIHYEVQQGLTPDVFCRD